MKDALCQNKLEQLVRIEIFKTLTPEELLALDPYIVCQSFKKGEAIIVEGEKGDTLHMVATGDVEIQKHTMEGEPYTCDFLPEALHCFFGEFSLLDSGVRSATVMAVTDVQTLVLNRSHFEQYCEAHQVAGYKLMKAIATRLISRLRKADNEIMTLFEALVEEIGKH